MNFNILSVFRKMNILLGMKILWIFLGVTTFLCILGYIPKGKVLNGGYFWGLLKCQIVLDASNALCFGG